METRLKLKDKPKALYKNVEHIILYFEDQFEPGLKWVREGNLMRLITNRNLTVCYDKKQFKKI